MRIGPAHPYATELATPARQLVNGGAPEFRPAMVHPHVDLARIGSARVPPIAASSLATSSIVFAMAPQWSTVSSTNINPA